MKKNIRKELLQLMIDMDSVVTKIDEEMHNEIRFPSGDEGILLAILIPSMDGIGTYLEYSSHEEMIADFKKMLEVKSNGY